MKEGICHILCPIEGEITTDFLCNVPLVNNVLDRWLYEGLYIDVCVIMYRRCYIHSYILLYNIYALQMFIFLNKLNSFFSPNHLISSLNSLLSKCNDPHYDFRIFFSFDNSAPPRGFLIWFVSYENGWYDPQCIWECVVWVYDFEYP